MKVIKTYQEFWPYYLKEHSNASNRTLHYLGITVALCLLILFLIFKIWLFLFVVPFCGYGFSWTGHFFFEKNKPATFKYPLWSLYSDFRMFYVFIKGRF